MSLCEDFNFLGMNQVGVDDTGIDQPQCCRNVILIHIGDSEFGTCLVQ